MPVVVVALDGGWHIHGLKAILRNLGGAGYRIGILAVLPAPTSRQEIVGVIQDSHDLIEDTLATWRNELPVSG